MVIAQITTDNREPFRQYEKAEPWFGTAPSALLQGFAATPNVQVHVIGCTQQPMASSPEKLADNTWFHSLHVPKIGWLRTGYQGCVRAIRRKLAEIRPDIVHGQGTERECSLGAVFSGFPNVLTIHGNMRVIAQVNRSPAFSFQWLAARIEGFTLPRTQGIVCITRYTQEAVERPGMRTWIVPNAVDEKYFALTPEPVEEKIILFVGHVSYRKNQNAFIRALDPLAERWPIRLVCLGLADRADPYAAEFFELAATRPWVKFTGWIEQAELREYYRRAALVALPSLEDNCPMAVLEGMAAGKPVLAARVGGVPELIEHEKTGLLCDPTKIEEMRAAVERLLGDDGYAQALAARGREHAIAAFHPAQIAARHVEIYREVLSTRS